MIGSCSWNRRCRVWAVVALLLVAPMVFAQTPNDPAVAKLEPKAREALKGFADALKSAKALAYTASVKTHVEGMGTNRDVETSQVVAGRRPNMFHMEYKSMNGNINVVCDGSDLYISHPESDRYRVQDAPEELAFLTDTGLGDPGMNLMEAFANEDPFAVLVAGIDEASYVGLEKLNEREAHHVRAKGAQLDWDLWLATNRAEALRLTVDLSKVMAEQSPGMAGVKMTAAVAFSDWQLGDEVPASLFAFTPPEGSTAMRPPEEPPHATLGNDVPPFKVALLDGSTLDYGSLKGKNIVVLDFWATYCGPCRVSLPLLNRVAKEYNDRGVVFCAVNVGEDVDSVRSFVQTMKLDANVGIDLNRSLGLQFMVEPIPHTVILDKAGKVYAVHIGGGLGSGTRLRKDLDALLAGKSAAKAAAPASVNQGPPAPAK